jgi:two-component system, NtrC family, sensor kinase
MERSNHETSMASDSPKGLSLRIKITIYAVVMSIISLVLASAITFALFSSQFKQTISDLNNIYKPLHTIEVKAVIACILTACVTGLIIWIAIGRLLTPLQNVIDHVGSLQTKKGSDRMLPDTLRGDLGKLGSVLNRMVAEFDAQRQALLSAEEEQRILSWAVDNNPNSIVITDPDGTIEYVNHKFCTLTGYSAAEAIGQNPRILKSGETPPEQYAELWRTISNGGNWHGEFHNRKKSGELYWENASIAPILDDQGRILRFLAVLEDITNRKIYEAELLNNTEELLLKHSELNAMFSLVNIGKREWEDTMDSIPEMVLMCGPSGAITRCNRAVTTFTGLSYNQILGLDCLELFVRSGMEIVSCDDNSGQMVSEGGARHFELLFNELRQIGSDDVRGSVVTIHETTEFRRMNENLQKTSADLQQAQAQAFQQEKMASIGQLAAGVAHEINNPMGFISSNLTTMGKYMQKLGAFETALIEAVQKRGDQETAALVNDVRAQMKIDFILKDLHSLLEESRDGAERVRCIVRDLKSFSHEDETKCKPLSINECLDSTLNMARNEIKYVADVERDYDPALPLLNGYPQKLNQVFMNLLVNAAHAIEGHGTIRLKTFSEGGDIVVCISDTGKGIAPENLTRIFEPFFTTKVVGKGTGLGLSISYDIIKNHGGILTVESEVGTGTTFTVRLPLNHAVCV